MGARTWKTLQNRNEPAFIDYQFSKVGAVFYDDEILTLDQIIEFRNNVGINEPNSRDGPSV